VSTPPKPPESNAKSTILTPNGVVTAAPAVSHGRADPSRSHTTVVVRAAKTAHVPSAEVERIQQSMPELFAPREIYAPPETDRFLTDVWSAAEKAFAALTEEATFTLDDGNYALALPAGPEAEKINAILRATAGSSDDAFPIALMQLANKVEESGGLYRQIKPSNKSANHLILTLTPACALAPAA